MVQNTGTECAVTGLVQNTGAECAVTGMVQNTGTEFAVTRVLKKPNSDGKLKHFQTNGFFSPFICGKSHFFLCSLISSGTSPTFCLLFLFT